MKKLLNVAFCLTILLFGPQASPGATNVESSLNIKLVGANSVAGQAAASQSTATSYYFSLGSTGKSGTAPASAPKAFYRNIYPGINLTCFGDEYQLEYVFTVSPGADPSLIRMLYEGIQSVSMTQAGGVRIIIPGGEVIQTAPVAFVESGKSSYRTDGSLQMGYGGTFSINPGRTFADKLSAMNNTRFNLIPAGGQPGGPKYDFYISKYETINDQFLRFLNDAEAHTNNQRGANMYFDKAGNIWINKRMKPNSDEMFDIAASQVVYDSGKSAGSRYSHWRTKNGNAPYANHPATGISWFGAIKYCNWLTIQSGRGDAECCYTEGTNTLDWAPVTATNWANGHFGDAERQAWLSVKGFRLPMVNCAANAITTNAFGEFFKAAAWSGTTNWLFGYGRNTFDGTDSNCRDTFAKTSQRTFPVGYFNGSDDLGTRLTHRNENAYGIFDLSGNAAEWMNDFGTNSNTESRALCGGSWAEAPIPINKGKIISPSATSTSGGIRTLTTYLPLDYLRIHILYSFFLEQASTQNVAAAEALPFTIPEPSSPETAATAEGGTQGGPSFNVNAPGQKSDNVMPDGITYKPGQGGTPGGTGGTTGGGGGGGGTTTLPASTNEVKGTTPPGPKTNSTLTVTSSNPNSGVLITVSPADNSSNTDGNTTFSRTYITGTIVTLTAPYNAGTNVFVNWLRNGVNFTPNQVAVVPLTSDLTMTAVYGPPAITNTTLTVTSSNPNSGVLITVSPADNSSNTDGNTTFSRTYNAGTLVTLTAPVNAGTNVFVRWLRNGANYTVSRVANVAMISDMTMTAVYGPPPVLYTLAVNSMSPSAGAGMTVNPIDYNGNGNGSTSFTRSYVSGSFVTVSASPAAGGNVFQKWQVDGVDTTTNLTTSVTMNSNHTITAFYVHSPIIIDPPPVSPGGV